MTGVQTCALPISQLAASPPPHVAPVLAVLTASDPPLAEGQELDAGDAFGRAAVGTLTQMASAAGNDLLWKPLNHAVRPSLTCIPYRLTASTPDGQRVAV